MGKVIHWDLESTNLHGDIGTILCFGYKFEGEKPKVVSVLDFPESFKGGKITDKYVVKAAAEILSSDKVGMWSTWFGKRFDVPMLNTRLLEHGLPPVAPASHCDGWEIARKKLKLHSNRLASVSAFLDVEEKTPLKLKVWRDAGSGHRPSINYVIKHCLQDTVVLEQVYERIKPFADAIRHPNMGPIRGVENGCPICSSKKLMKRGYSTTTKFKWQRLQCRDCGHWLRGERL